MEIPIQNIYYLLCYAWNKLEEADTVSVNASDYEQLPDLLAKVLVNGCNHLIKQGFDKSYIETTELYNGIKGKLEFTQTIKTFALSHGKTVCSYDEFSMDILENQLIKSTLNIIIRLDKINAKIKNDIRGVLIHFNEVADILPSDYDFNRVKIHRNNRHYDFLLKICQLIVNNISLDEKSGHYKFKDLIRDQKTMQALFEDFVRNFYAHKLPTARVKRDHFPWKARAINDSNFKFLPEMHTDTSIRTDNNKTIIDTKYYTNTLSLNQFDQYKFHSGNLYQIYSYLKNIEQFESDALNLTARGILLYPTTSIELDEHFQMDNHLVSVCTVNLASDWRKIESRLLDLLNSPS